MSDEIESVISAAVEDSGDVVDAGSESAEVADAPEGDVSVDVPAPTPAVVEQEDLFAKEHGLTVKRPDGRENRIPYSRVKAIADSQVKKAQEAAEAAFKSVRDEHGSYKSRLAEIEAVEKIMAEQPERFIQMMAQANPAYARFAKVLEQAQEAQADEEDDDAEPTPDFDLGEGRKTYSMDGLNKLRAWDRRQSDKSARAAFEKELAPLKDRYKAETERQQQERYHSEATTKIQAQLDKAKTWHGFEDNHKDILAAFNADKTLSLHDAYMKVVIPKLAADRTKMRQELIAEMKKAPTATSTTTTQTPTKPTGQESIEDVIRASVAKLGKR